jgi:hypothetical protein
MEPQAPTQALTPRRRGNPNWRPGISGNPLGGRSRQNRIDAEIAKQVADYVETYGHAPSHMESTLIGSIALNLVNRQRAPANSERSTNLSREIRHDLRELRVMARRRSPKPKPAPLPTARDYYNGGCVHGLRDRLNPEGDG